MFLLFFILMLVTQHALGVEVIEGAESVVLPCKAPPGKASSVTWSREDLKPSDVHVRIKIDQDEEDDLTNQNQLFTNRTEVQPDALRTGHVSLTLKHIQLSDDGIYSCIVLGGDGDRLTNTQVQLKVTSKEEVELRKQEEELRKQQEAEARRQRDIWIAVVTIILIILCIVAAVLGWLYCSGYIWQKVPQVVVDSGEESVLLRCRTIRLLPKDIRVQWTDGDKRKLHVSLNGSDQPGEQDDLYRGRTEMKRQRPGDLSLTLKHPTGRDRDTYTCTVYSREGDILMVRQVLLWVKGLLDPQVEVDSGVESVLLRCEATGQLPEDVRVEWTDGDMIVHVSLKGSDQPGEQDDLYRGRTEMKRETPGDLSLTLKHPTYRDSKLYTCTVYSREGKVLMRRHVELKVKEQQVVVEQGAESVLLPFKTTDLPEDVRVTWRRPDAMETVHVFQDSSDQQDQQDQQDPSYRGRTEMKRDLEQGDVSLILKHPTGTDRGRYSCSVYSKEGDIRRETTFDLRVRDCLVEVKQGAESIELPFKTRELPEDVRVTWRRLDPMELVHVFQDGSDQQDQQDPSYRGRTEMKGDLRQGDVSLTLKHPTETDRGRYSCRVYSKKEDIRREKTVWLYIKGRQVKEEESVLQPEVPELTSTHEGYQLVNMDPAESC